MRQVWKFPLASGESIMKMPADAELLHVSTQARGSELVPCVWALVDPAAPLVRRGFSVHGTGHEVLEGGRYVGTFHLPGPFVFHVFDHGEDPTA